MTRAEGGRGGAAAPANDARTRPGVLLVAHGSARSGESAEPVLALGAGLRAKGFPEVRCAFWKEEPFLHQALTTLRSPAIAVLPVFLAEGYFTRTVVPRELDLAPGSNRTNGRAVHLLAPLGVHPGMADLVAERGREAVPAPEARKDALLVVLGHGTPRDPGSAAAARAVADRLARTGDFGRVEPVFIDQSPRVEDVVTEAPEPLVVVVPFLISAGWHGGTTVPRDLGLDASGRDPAGRIVYTPPVGTHPGLAALAAAVIDEAAPAAAGGAPASPLDRAEARLAARLERDGVARLLQVRIATRRGGGYALRHVDDESADPGTLHELDPAALLLHGRRGVGGGHRPLRTGADLRPGWRARVPDRRGLTEALVALYGAALVHWALADTLRPASFQATADRQSGMYARLAGAAPSAVAAGIDRCCEGIPCLRQRLWTLRAATPSIEVGAALTKGAELTRGAELIVPCPSPCPVLLSAVLAATEADPGSGSPPGETPGKTPGEA